jgi:hypothetical protein
MRNISNSAHTKRPRLPFFFLKESGRGSVTILVVSFIYSLRSFGPDDCVNILNFSKRPSLSYILKEHASTLICGDFIPFPSDSVVFNFNWLLYSSFVTFYASSDRGIFPSISSNQTPNSISWKLVVFNLICHTDRPSTLVLRISEQYIFPTWLLCCFTLQRFSRPTSFPFLFI